MTFIICKFLYLIVAVFFLNKPSAYLIKSFVYFGKNLITFTGTQINCFRAIVEALLDYFVWLQLLLIVAICLDRTGHILKPLTYTFSIKTSGTALACFTCLLLPFVLQTIPYIVMVEQTIRQNFKDISLIGCDKGDSQCVLKRSFHCDHFGNYEFHEIHGRTMFAQSNTKLFLSEYHSVFKFWFYYVFDIKKFHYSRKLLGHIWCNYFCFYSFQDPKNSVMYAVYPLWYK